MPPASQSPASTRRRNVTGIIARYEDCSIDVCKAGGVVALHIGTRAGVVVATFELREFTLKCRGPLDHNLNQLPTYEEVIGPDDPAAPAVPPELMGHGREMDPDQKRKFQSALKDYRKGMFKTKKAACIYHRCEANYQSFVSWSKKPAQQSPNVVGLTDRPFITKPGGKVL